MQKRKLPSSSSLTTALTGFAYALGVVWRWFHITRWHDPRQFLLADAQAFMTLAKRLAQPGYVPRVADTLYAPGNTWLLTFFLRRDPSQQQQVYFEFLICALLPLAVGALGWVTFGRRTAKAAIVIASGYFAFVDIGGYFFPDVHLALLGTLSIVAYLLAMKIAGEAPSRKRTVGLAALAASSGLLFSLAMALDTVALPAILGFCATHFVFTRGPTQRAKAVVLAVFLVASMPLTALIAKRCTTANAGHFCSSSTGHSADFLLGHYDRIGSLEWRDPDAPDDSTTRLNVAAHQHGNGEKRVVPFRITDQEKSSEYAWSWVRQNPGKALVLSFEHVWDCFGGTYPAPTITTYWWRQSYAAHFLFLTFVLAPCVIVLIDRLRRRGVVGLLRSVELLMVAPVVGVSAAAFATTGEIRCRVPWDGFLIVLGLQFYRRFKAEAVEEPSQIVETSAEAEDRRSAARRIRIALLVVGVAAIGGAIRAVVWAWPDSHHFRASSSSWGFPGAGRIGDHGDSGLFFHTAEEENPWVEIDLGEVRDVDRVIVENRSDGNSERAVPLVVELGDVRHHFKEVARRAENFDRWTASFPKQQARYVKLRVPRKTIFHLRNVEIP
jgi:F5/8 type C domain